ncbi:MAG TPA: PEP-CTERM sorting domain-containing protein [Verrucomicrobiales bacterium]|nr:PEP-CTERM sorting domain-containing protein [Verrucomicrobiales bacterium]
MKFTSHLHAGAKSAFLFALSAAMSAVPARAATFTWDGGGSDDFFKTGGNWAGNVAPPNNGTADIVFAGTTRLNPFLQDFPDWNLNSITFASGAGSFNFEFSIFDISQFPLYTLGIGAGGITNNDNSLQTITSPGSPSQATTSYLQLNADQTWNAAAGPITMAANVEMGGRTLTLDGVFGKTFTQSISGGGAILLSGGVANFAYANQPFAGDVTASAGTTINLQASGATGTGTLTLNGGTVQSLVSGSIGNDVVLGAGTTSTFTGSNSLMIDGFVKATGGSTTLNIANSSLSGVSVNGGLQVLAGSGLTRSGTGKLSLGDAFLSSDNTINSIYGTLNLNTGANVVAIPTTIGTGGIVNVNGAATTVAANADITIREGGALNVNSGTFSYAPGPHGHTVTVDGGALSSTGTLALAAGTALTVKNGGQALLTGSFTTPFNFPLSVSGHGSLFNTTGDLFIQNGNTTSVTVDGDLSAGGRLVVSNGSAGTLLVDGSGSKLTIGGAGPNISVVGSGNAGTLTLSSGATGTIGNALIVGNSPAGSKGELNLYTGSRLTVNSDLFIGTATTAGTTGSVDIDGLGSKLTVAGAGSVLTIGAASGSTATVTVGDGATLLASSAAGGGTVLNNTGTLIINGGTADLGPLTRNPGSDIVFNSGSLSFGGNVTVNNLGLLGGSTTLNATRSLTLTGTTTIEAESGLAVTGGSLTTGSLYSNGNLNVSGGSVTLTSGALTAVSLDNIIPASVTVSGAGKLHLSSAGAVAGNLGTLTFSGGTLDAGTGPLTANAGGSVIYQSNTLINGGVLGGPGQHLITAGGARFDGGTLAAGVTLLQNAASTFTNFSVAGTLSSNQPLTFAGSTAITGTVAIAAGGSTATGPVTVSGGGLLDLNAGTFTSSALLSANTGGTIDIGPGVTLAANGGVLVNGGTLTRAATGVLNPGAFTLTGGGHAVFNGGLDYNVAHTTTVSGAGTQLDVLGGQLLVDAGGAMNILGGAHVLVEGRLVSSNLQSGAIVVDGPGTQLNAQGTAAPVSVIGSQATGTLTVSNGAAVSIGNEIYIGNSPVTSNGTVSVLSGGQYTSSADVRLANFTTAGIVGVIDVTGAGSAFTITGATSNLLAGAASGSTATINVGPGGTFNASQEAGGGVTLNPTATLNVNGGTANLGPLTLNGGHINLNSGTLTYAGGLTLAASGVLGENVTLNAGRNVAITGAANVPAGQTLTISGGSLAASGVTVAGSASLTGGGTLSTGSLVVNAPGVFTIGATGTLNMPFGDVLLGINGASMVFNGTTYNAASNSLNSQFGSDITYEGGARIFGGFLKGQGTHTVGPAGGGPLGNARFTGTTLLNGATLQQANPARLTNFTGSGTILSSAALVWDGGVLTSSGVLNVNASSVITASGFESHGIIAVAGGGKVINSVGDFVLGGGSRTSIVSGGNITALAGTDIELNGGLLVNNGSLTGALNVNFGSLAKGAGAFGTVNVTDGGRFSPGNSPGIATITTMTFSPGGRYDFELNSASQSGNGADFLDISGQLNIDAGTTANSRFTLGVVSLNAANESAPLMDFDPAQSYHFHLATADGGVSGFNIGEFTLDLSEFKNPYTGTFSISADANNLYLNYAPVPEPSSVLLLLLGGFAARRRRRV